jgi:hypothetical protein
MATSWTFTRGIAGTTHCTSLFHFVLIICLAHSIFPELLGSLEDEGAILDHLPYKKCVFHPIEGHIREWFTQKTATKDGQPYSLGIGSCLDSNGSRKTVHAYMHDNLTSTTQRLPRTRYCTFNQHGDKEDFPPSSLMSIKLHKPFRHADNSDMVSVLAKYYLFRYGVTLIRPVSAGNYVTSTLVGYANICKSIEDDTDSSENDEDTPAIPAIHPNPYKRLREATGYEANLLDILPFEDAEIQPLKPAHNLEPSTVARHRDAIVPFKLNIGVWEMQDDSQDTIVWAYLVQSNETDGELPMIRYFKGSETSPSVDYVRSEDLFGRVIFRDEISLLRRQSNASRDLLPPVIYYYFFKRGINLPFPFTITATMSARIKQAANIYRRNRDDSYMSAGESTLRSNITPPHRSRRTSRPSHMPSVDVPRIHFVCNTCNIPRHTDLLEVNPKGEEHCIYCIGPKLEVSDCERQRFCIGCNKAKAQKNFWGHDGLLQQTCLGCTDGTTPQTPTVDEFNQDFQDSYTDPRRSDQPFGIKDERRLKDELMDETDISFIPTSQDDREATITLSAPVTGTNSPPAAAEGIVHSRSNRTATALSNPTLNTSYIPNDNVPAADDELNTLLEKYIRAPFQKIEDDAAAHSEMADIIDRELDSAITNDAIAEATVAELQLQLRAAQEKRTLTAENLVHHQERKRNHDLKKPDVKAEKKLVFSRFPALAALLEVSLGLESDNRDGSEKKRRKTDGGSKDSPWTLE